jgi:hypothetical protein
MACPLRDGKREPGETMHLDAMPVSRAHKKRAHPTGLLTEPRASAKARIREQGQPKKQR